MKRPLILLLSLFLSLTCSAQQKFTYEYAVKDTHHLKLDVYVPDQQNEQHSCMVFAFGGGFVNGARDDNQIPALKEYYTQKGWVVISIDYRLGMQGKKNLRAISNISNYEQSIEMAGEDMISATDYILRNLLSTPHFTINPEYIVLVGSSAGAITALEADYFLGNRIHGAELLPDSFRYAGIIPFSGAVFSRKGKVKYCEQAPAPTLFLHGTKDHIVTYKQIRLFNLGLFGSNALVKRFKKLNYPYYIRRYKGVGHEVAGYFRTEFTLMDEFIQDYIFDKEPLQTDELCYSSQRKTKTKKKITRTTDMMQE